MSKITLVHKVVTDRLTTATAIQAAAVAAGVTIQAAATAVAAEAIIRAAAVAGAVRVEAHPEAQSGAVAPEDNITIKYRV